VAKKYYAVKKGKKTGIFNSWDECQSYVAGFSNAQYKSFKTYDEANAYLNNNNNDSLVSNVLPEIPSNSSDCLIAYVDGSYNDVKKIYSYGVVLLTDPPKTYSKADNKPELVEHRNVAGEVLGAMASMNYAKKHGYKQIIIYHDYEGIAKWPLREWKAKKPFTKEYTMFFDGISQFIKIKFMKVAAHTGDTYNELADKLAKKAISTFQTDDAAELTGTETTCVEDYDTGLLKITKINNGKLGMLNINFPYQGTYIYMSDIHEIFKRKCKPYKLKQKNIKELFIFLKPSFDAIEYTVRDNQDNSFKIVVDFKEAINNEV
jgi:ribonuclease HI